MSSSNERTNNVTINPTKYINKTKQIITIVKKQVKTITTKEINHENIVYNNNKYTVCYVPFNDKHKLFIIDFEDRDKVINKLWHFMAAGSYISHTYNDEIVKDKQLYLHNLIMNKLTFDGKGQQHTVDHINRIGLDNRKANLRFAESQSIQNFNQKIKDRKAVLPENCNISINDIPKNVWYGKPNGKHGEFFCFQIKGLTSVDGGEIVKYSTKSTKVSLEIKLKQIISLMDNLILENPELQNIIINKQGENNREKLIQEYNEIISLSSFNKEIIYVNLIKFTTELKENIIDVDQIDYEKCNKIKLAGKKVDKLPIDCNITIDMIPKYCYFKPESDKRGCKFIIDRHPNIIIKEIRQVCTPETKTISIEEKFRCLIEILDIINIDQDLITTEDLNNKINDIRNKYLKNKKL